MGWRVRETWFTESLRVNDRTRKAVAVQGKAPLSEAEWQQFLRKLEELKPQIVAEPAHTAE